MGILSLVSVTIVFLAGCPAGASTGASHTLSGKVFDDSSGQAVSGLTVEFASYSATTAGDGSFSIDLGQATGIITGAFSVHGTGYCTFYVSGCSLDASVDTNITWFMQPANFSAYPVHNITGHVYEKQTSTTTPTEIGDNSGITTYVFNKNGARAGSNGFYYTYNRSSGYNTNTTAFGSDCLVAASVSPSGKTPFNVVVNSVDLSLSPQTLNLTQDLAHTTTVTVNGAVGNMGSLSLVSPYRVFSVGGVTFTSSPSAQMNVTNPDGYSGIWSQMKQVTDFPILGYNKMSVSCSSIAPIGTPVTLPAIDDLLGPTGRADPATLSYSSGTLSVSPVAGATAYRFVLTENVSGNNVANILSTTPSVSLPSWFSSQLATLSIRVAIVPMDSNMTLDVAKIVAVAIGGGTAPGLKATTVDSASGNNWKDLTF